ncbi:MAG: M36 family metallopeptidase [Stagnimonas sp.]|nr:M36 family metallopeptidase [Stagnimonas sp.]
MKLRSFFSATALGLTLGASVAPIWAAECLPPPTGKALAHATVATRTGFAGDGEHGGLLNFDRFRTERRSSGLLAAVPEGFEGRHQQVLFDRQLGLPTFLWARTDAQPAAVGALTSRELLIARAREHLRSEAPLLKLSEAMIADAKVTDAQYNGNGPAVVRFAQQVQGIDVFSRKLNVLLDRSGKPVATSGYFATDLDAASLAGREFTRSAAQAIAAGMGNLGQVLDAALLKPAVSKAGYQWFQVPALTGSQVWERMPRAKAIYYPRNGRLEPAYYVELFTKAKSNNQLSAYGLVVSGLDSGILHRRNLVANATPFSYTVFADGEGNNFTPWDSPLGNGYTPFPGSAPNERLARVGTVETAPKVTLASILTVDGTVDPWLPDGATTTTGNNTDACIDIVDSPTSALVTTPLDPLTNSCIAAMGDLRPATTSANTFDYALAPDEDPSNENAKSAAAVSLFYINNWLHDWWYVHGFNEEAGNAQTSNYGRAPDAAEGDPINAQGQDASGRSNANMATPADGSSPTMQQYLFDGPVIGAVKQVEPTVGEPLLFSVGSFSVDSFDVPATSVVLAADSSGEPADGCGPAIVEDPTGLGVIPTIPAPPQASLSGAIALVDRGSCSFTTKARFGQLSGAAAVIIVNNTGGDPIPMANADLPVSVPLPLPLPIALDTDFTYTVPTVMIRKDDGDAIKALIAAGQDVKMTLQRSATTDLDGTLDNQIVAHEFFHYVHHRLTDSSNQQSGAMSEGWGDIDAFMLATRPEDRLVPGNDRYQGAYGLAGYVVNSFYSGIRRAPYSTDMAKNAFTLQHLSDGTATPDGGTGASNSEVHNAGEIWANQMWECYVGLLNDPRHSFTEAQSRMKDYIIGGLKQTPADATFTEARDAVLAVALATDFQDYKACSDGFAKRGSGLNAVAPARDSADLVGVTEDYTPFVCAVSGSSSGGSSSSSGGSGSSSSGGSSSSSSGGSSGGSASGADGRFGGGLNLLLLVPMLILGLRRRRR